MRPAKEVADLEGYSIDDFPLGKGAFGNVYKVKKDDTGELYAMKVVKKSHQNYQKAKDEISIHTILKHPNIAGVVASFDTAKDSIVIMELCGINLFDYRKKRGGMISENEAVEIIKQISSGIAYMHHLGYSHRDIKLENIVKCGETWKIIDFGYSSKSIDKHWEACCTLDYLAPESLNGGPYLGNPTDVWSLGVVFYELIYGISPFYDKMTSGTYRKIRSAEPSLGKTKVDNLIREMLTKDPDARIDIDSVNQRL